MDAQPSAIHLTVFCQVLASDTYVFSLQPHQKGDYPPVFVIISLDNHHLCLSYFVKKTNWLIFEDFSIVNANFTDYLWQANCFECFFEIHNALGYLELNLAPNGAFAIYRFEDYRTPKQMPPLRSNDITIHQIHPQSTKDWHARHLRVNFNPYLLHQSKQSKPFITKIQPTVILYHDEQPIYYAAKHASPADFHDKTHWQVLPTNNPTMTYIQLN